MHAIWLSELQPYMSTQNKYPPYCFEQNPTVCDWRTNEVPT